MKWASIFLTLTLCFAFADGAFAQRTLPGQKGIQFTAGTVNGLNPETGFYSGIAFTRYAKSANKWAVGVEYLEKRHSYRDIKIPQSQFTVDVGYYLKCLSDWRKTFIVSTGLSAVAGYETVNWDKKLLFDGGTLNSADGFLYGGALTFEAEIYLTDRFVLLAGVRERLLMGSSVGKFNTQFGLGIKFIIN